MLKFEWFNYFCVVVVFVGICDVKKIRSVEYIVDFGMKRLKEIKKYIFFG